MGGKANIWLFQSIPGAVQFAAVRLPRCRHQLARKPSRWDQAKCTKRLWFLWHFAVVGYLREVNHVIQTRHDEASWRLQTSSKGLKTRAIFLMRNSHGKEMSPVDIVAGMRTLAWVHPSSILFDLRNVKHSGPSFHCNMINALVCTPPAPHWPPFSNFNGNAFGWTCPSRRRSLT